MCALSSCVEFVQEGKTCLLIVVDKGEFELVEFMVANGASSANVESQDGGTPLHLAAKGTTVGLVKIFLQHKADPALMNRVRQISAVVLDG